MRDRCDHFCSDKYFVFFVRSIRYAACFAFFFLVTAKTLFPPSLRPCWECRLSVFHHFLLGNRFSRSLLRTTAMCMPPASFLAFCRMGDSHLRIVYAFFFRSLYFSFSVKPYFCILGFWFLSSSALLLTECAASRSRNYLATSIVERPALPVVGFFFFFFWGSSALLLFECAASRSRNCLAASAIERPSPFPTWAVLFVATYSSFACFCVTFVPPTLGALFGLLPFFSIVIVLFLVSNLLPVSCRVLFLTGFRLASLIKLF